MGIVAKNPFSSSTLSLLTPSRHFGVITPSDDDELVEVSRCVTVTPPGDVRVTSAENVDSIIPADIWAIEPVQIIQVKKIWATGTDPGLTIFVK
jgi:hypothetical protein